MVFDKTWQENIKGILFLVKNRVSQPFVQSIKGRQSHSIRVSNEPHRLNTVNAFED